MLVRMIIFLISFRISFIPKDVYLYCVQLGPIDDDVAERSNEDNVNGNNDVHDDDVQLEDNQVVDDNVHLEDNQVLDWDDAYTSIFNPSSQIALGVDGLPWGIRHPDKRPIHDRSMRVKWSNAEVQYVRHWLSLNNDAPVRKLYDDVHKCSEARNIFHQHHTDLDRLAYMYKIVRNE